MHSIYDQISCLSLREIAFPGSHDAGMSELDSTAGGAVDWNTLTQKLDISEQLQYGSRWFDIRPVLSGGKYKTGHYGFGLSAWRGGNGQRLSTIIDQVNVFAATNKELIILDVSHGLNTDEFVSEHDSGLTQEQWDEVMEQLLLINDRALINFEFEDLADFTMKDLIDDRSLVLIVVDADTKTGEKVDTSKFAGRGIFNRAQFDVYNKYSDQDDQSGMIDDQLSKLKDIRQTPNSEMFVLSWTLTQAGIESAFVSIVAAGEDANRALPELLWPELTTNTYPNVLYVDAYPDNGVITALAMAINLYLTRTC